MSHCAQSWRRARQLLSGSRHQSLNGMRVSHRKLSMSMQASPELSSCEMTNLVLFEHCVWPILCKAASRLSAVATQFDSSSAVDRNKLMAWCTFTSLKLSSAHCGTFS